MFTDTTQIKLTKNLLLLERREDELLLVNIGRMRPLYIPRGKDYIKGFLDRITGLEIKQIIKKYPKERQLLNMLAEYGILIPSAISEENLYIKEGFGQCQNKKNPQGQSLYLLVSQACNLSCVYCLNGERTYHSSRNLLMKERVAFCAVEKSLEQIAKGGKLEVVFFGGEPLLNWKLVKKTIIYTENTLKPRFPEHKIHYHLTTNLTIFPKDMIEWAKRYNITFLCDIDGPEDLHNQTRPYKEGKGSYRDIVKNVACLQKEGLKVSLRATITSHNVKRMTDITKHHKELNGDGSAFVAVNPVTSDQNILPIDLFPDIDMFTKGLIEVYKTGIWNLEEIHPLNEYVNRLKPETKMFWGCGAPLGNTPVVDVNGDVYFCIYLVGIKRFCLGNLFDGYPYKKTIEKMSHVLHVDNIEECCDCNFRYLCGGGCPVKRLTVENNPQATAKVKRYASDITCKPTKALLELLFWELAEKRHLEVTGVKPNTVRNEFCFA